MTCLTWKIVSTPFSSRSSRMPRKYHKNANFMILVTCLRNRYVSALRKCFHSGCFSKQYQANVTWNKKIYTLIQSVTVDPGRFGRLGDLSPPISRMNTKFLQVISFIWIAWGRIHLHFPKEAAESCPKLPKSKRFQNTLGGGRVGSISAALSCPVYEARGLVSRTAAGNRA